MNNPPRKTSRRQVVDEHSPTYRRAVAAIAALVQTGGAPVPRDRAVREAPEFYRGARVRRKT